MRTTFFSLAALAVSAFAAPVVDNVGVAPRVNEVGDAVKIIDSTVVEDLGIGEIIDGATATPKRAGLDADTLVEILTNAVKSVKTQTSSLNQTASAVKSGKTTKADGTNDAVAALADMHFSLSEVVNKLTTAAGIPVADADVDKVLNLVVILLSEVLFTVKTLVTILGLRPQLVSLLHSVFGLLANIITLVIGLVSGLLPGLVAGLSPLLAALGNGLLVPLLTPIVALVAGLAGQ